MGNAAGKMLRPLILYKGKMHIESHFRDTRDACYIGTSSSGVMDTDVLTEFLEKEFLSSITCPKNVLFCDGHSSHLSCIPFLVACMEHEKEIRVVVLLSGQTAFLQPLDKEVFGGVKQKWHSYLRDSRLDTTIDVSRTNFPAHIVKLWRPDCPPYSFNLGKNLLAKVIWLSAMKRQQTGNPAVKLGGKIRQIVN
ncbi:hypothetical protein RvY_14096 [Ramazzottius varieornatus]|uniref:DDE-1 domain-containing protein n=1 Tax=Ramazzottius varieornatus TaxID=947166 RepID=A0A1D1VQ51_RAMVA|nr:hypothetical protein RvY_14096 [Ramazzottius varieornatus]